MLRSLIFLILINVPVVALAAWQESHFKLNTSYSFTKAELDSVYVEPSYLHQLTLSAEKQHLFDGFGIRAKADISSYYIKQSELAKSKTTDHFIQLDGVLFLSENSDLLASYRDSKKLQHFDNRLNNILQGFTEELLSEVDEIAVDFSLGKDKSHFFFQLNYNQIQQQKIALVNERHVESGEHDKFSADFLWRQSDDTLWGGRVENVQTERTSFVQHQQVDINNYYLQVVTSYLGNSQLTVNLGRSETELQDQFSWDITHKSFFSEHTNLSLQSTRKFVQPLDNSAGEDLNTQHQLRFRYQPLDYIESQLQYSFEQRKKNSVKTHDISSLAVNLSVKYQSAWRVSASLQKQRLQDHTGGRDISQNMISLTISGELV